MLTILLLEDDVSLNETVTEFLEENGYKVLQTYDGEDAQDKIYENRIDLLLLDVNVPNIDGFKLLKEERAKGNEAPAIFITSMDSVDDVERGFGSGGNDYIRKPFALKELLLRIENLTKNSINSQERVQIDEDMYFDIPSNTLHVKENAHTFQNKEAMLLKLFLCQKEKIIPHHVIMETLWEYDESPSDAALRTYIKNLRKFIGKDRIVSFKKLGYKFTTK